MRAASVQVRRITLFSPGIGTGGKEARPRVRRLRFAVGCEVRATVPGRRVKCVVTGHSRARPIPFFGAPLLTAFALAGGMGVLIALRQRRRG